MSDVNCSVRMTADGIDVADYSRVFVPFMRLDNSRSKETGGFGLGLSIVRRIAYWHAGRAEVGASVKLGGACMSIKLPQRQDNLTRSLLFNS